MDHRAHQRLDSAEITDSLLEDAPVYGPLNEQVGRISRLHRTAASTGVVIDIGGFLGIGARPVLVALSELDLMRDKDGTVHGVTSWTREELANFPQHRG
jgi:hypothetical protein